MDFDIQKILELHDLYPEDKEYHPLAAILYGLRHSS